jgi:hypothetical protein
MTNDIYARFSQHIRCEGNNITKNMWIAELRELNQMVIMRTLEEVETVEEVRKREAHWIQQYLAQGANLLNLTGSKSITFDQFQSFFANEDGDPDASDIEMEDDPDDEMTVILHKFPGVEQWLIAGKKSVSGDEIISTTGLTPHLVRRREKDKTFRRTKRPGFYQIDSVYKWLKDVETAKLKVRQ